ncbi:unnamed protein product [Camellia sinensis]
MAIEVNAVPFSYVAHVLAIAGAVMVLVWCIHFRGGLAWESSNKSLIFNAEIAIGSLTLCRPHRVDNGPRGGIHYAMHPVLMLIGLIIIGGEAIMSYKSLPLKKEVKKLIHLVLHAIALILGIIGVYAAFKYHNESSIANLYSLHSWLGIGIISLYGIQLIKARKVDLWIHCVLLPGGTDAIRRESVPWHALFGLFVYVLAVGNAALGFLEKLTFLENSGVAKYGSEAFVVIFSAVITILFGAFVMLTVLSRAPPEDDYSYSTI